MLLLGTTTSPFYFQWVYRAVCTQVSCFCRSPQSFFDPITVSPPQKGLATLSTGTTKSSPALLVGWIDSKGETTTESREVFFHVESVGKANRLCFNEVQKPAFYKLAFPYDGLNSLPPKSFDCPPLGPRLLHPALVTLMFQC